MEYTLKQLNYFRACYIAFNLVSKGLRKVFKQEWDFRYKTTPSGEWKDIPQNGHAFYSKESRGSRRNNKRLLATIQRGNTEDWDCSCLFFALLYSDCIGSTLNPAVGKEVDDLRQVRNDIAHLNEVELTDAEFRIYVARVLAAFNSLSLPTNEVDDIKSQTDFPTVEVNNLKMQVDNLKADLKTKEEENKNLNSKLQLAQETLQSKQEEVEILIQEINSKVQSFCTLTFKPSHTIIKRSSDVARIMKKLDELKNESNGAISTIFLSGIPGCGKSQLARQLGQDVFDMREGGEGLMFVATLNAETLDSLADSYSSLARHLGITEYTLTNLETSTKGNPREKIQHLKQVIYPKTKQFSNWLIIADNVVDLSLVCGELPPTGSEEWGHGQVLITTQDSSSIPSNAPLTYHESISNGMHPDDAVNLLRQVCQIQDQKQDENEVAEVLEYQPLALAAAAFYVQTIVVSGSPNYHWKDYLEALSRGEREAAEELLANQNIAYSKTTTSAIQMAVMRALETDEVLREVFCLFSLCAAKPLPVEVAVDFIKLRVTGQTEELIKTKLLSSTLLSCLQGNEDPYTFLRMHDIVHKVLQSVMLSKMERKDRFQCISFFIKVFQSLIETNIKQLHSSRHVFAMLTFITSHCKVLHEYVHTYLKNSAQTFLKAVSPRELVSFLSSSAAVCCDLSNPLDAHLFAKSSDACTYFLHNFKEDKMLRATIYSILGNVYSDLRRYSEAKEWCVRALKITKDIYGDHHIGVAASYNNLGNVHTGLREYTKAKGYYEKALVIREENYGEHPGDVAASYNNLGIVYRNLGQYSEAKIYCEKTLIITKQIYGEKHGLVAANLNNLGNVYRNLNDQYNQAKEYYEKALIIRKEIYGENHRDVAESYSNLGAFYNNLRQYSEAKEYYEKALAISKKIYGEKHGDVAAGYSNLGNVCSGLGQDIEATHCHEKASIITKMISSEQQNETVRTFLSLRTAREQNGASKICIII